MFSKYATFDNTEILDIKTTPTSQRLASLDKFSDYNDYRTSDGYVYARIRAISSRVNKNNDGWPSIELAGSPELFERHQSSTGGFTVEASGGSERGFATFVGKPIFVDHHNTDPEDTRGVIVDAKLHVEDARTASGLDPYYASAPDNHKPPTWVELLLEVDAKEFPKFAKALIEGSKDSKKGIDGFSMGCFVPGTPITLDDGTQKNIEDIKPDDKVLTHRGNIEPVTHTMTRHYDGIVYEVHSYSQAKPMTLTEEHPVWTKNGWTEAKDLKPGDMVLTPTFKTGEAIPNTPWARLIGFYLAEGNLGYDKKRYPDGRPVFVEWNFDANKESHLVEQVKKDLVSMRYKPCGPYVKNNCATIRCNSPQLAASFLANAGQHSWEKKLTSDIVTFWNKQDQKAILDSYFQGDANRLNEHRVEIGTASKDLAHQVQAMATRVGYRITPPVKQHSPSAAHKRAKYSLQGILDGLYQNKNCAHLDEQGLWRKITKIEPKSYNGIVYNFDVGGDDSYVAADIAVHNCDVEYTICSHCDNKAESPDDFCEHIKLKGAHLKSKKTGKTEKAYEDCYGIKFFEISGVFDPADETALVREVRSSLKHSDNPLPQDDHIHSPDPVDTLREDKICPICGSNYDGATCEVCGYVEPPEGVENPDLEKAQQENPEMGSGDKQEEEKVTELPDANKGIPDNLGNEKPGQSYLDARKDGTTSHLNNEMAWKASGYYTSKKLNKGEVPILSGSPPQSNEPVETIIKDPLKPTIARTQENNMANNRTAADPLPDARADKRVDVTGIGGVIEDSNESASKADAQIDVVGVGGTGVENVEADEHQSINETSDNAGFDQGGDPSNNSGKTKTFPNKDQTSPVTSETPYWSQENKWSATHIAYDDKTLEQNEQQGNKPAAGGGTAVKGTQPVDPVGKADDRVNLLEHKTSPENNSGETKTWSGTDGNGVTKQQDPVTREPTQFGGINSHVKAVFKLADTEIDMGIIEKVDKWDRIAQLETQSEAELNAAIASLKRVRTAGLKKNTNSAVAGKVPSLREASTQAPEPVLVDDRFDAALFA